MPDIDRYDLNVILDPGLSEAQIQTEKDAVASQIERADGTVAALDEWGIQRLAYPIRKQNEGYYLVYRLDLHNDTPKSIEAVPDSMPWTPMTNIDIRITSGPTMAVS